MTARSRDTLALYAIAALAVLLTLYGDVGIGHMLETVLARL